MPSVFDLSNLWKYLAAWLVMLLVSVANGAARDFTYGRHLGELAAHQISTASGVLLLGAVLAFLAFNIRTPWRRRAGVFLGDAGSEFLGLAIAWACFRLTQNDNHPVSQADHPARSLIRGGQAPVRRGHRPRQAQNGSGQGCGMTMPAGRRASGPRTEERGPRHKSEILDPRSSRLEPFFMTIDSFTLE